MVTSVTEAGKPRLLVKGTEVRLKFAGEPLTITAGCNSMVGRYRLVGSTLTVEPLAMTEMACDPARAAQDSWVAQLFAVPVEFTPAPTEARIVSGSTVLGLADRRNVSPDKPLVGTTWLLDLIGAGGSDGSVSSVPAPRASSASIRSSSATRRL